MLLDQRAGPKRFGSHRGASIVNAHDNTGLQPLTPAHSLPFNTLQTQKELNAFYLRELSAPGDFSAVPSQAEYARVYAIEQGWNLWEESRLDLRDLPGNSKQFEDWYVALRQQHRKEMEPFFDFLAEQASLPQVAFFCALEAHVDGKFDDIIALSQIGMSGDMKLALAENFWDEMGLGEL